ncbi:MAG: RtcB family protein [Firmicutes bacterium]|nr:RtcB family protein [Bacillota bacterium]
MFVLFHPNRQKYPIKVWLRKPEQVDDGCLEQALRLANLPFLHQWVALMPDTHQGIGMPIGGVIALKDVIIPNAVGVDIGCGMAYVQTDLPAEVLKKPDTPNGQLIQAVIGDILRNIPVGFAHHKQKQNCRALDRARADLSNYRFAGELIPELEAGYFQVGTLGGGNHFIELQEDEEGLVGIMLHSGSRNFGLKICRYFNEIAKELNKRKNMALPKEYNLAFLPTDSKEGKSYIAWMNLALEFARENRERMLEQVMEILSKWVEKYTEYSVSYSNRINCHHNYAALEEHYGAQVWVHRKGAIRAGKDEPGIIPGAMGSFSYLVKGLGNPESFESCSHGAGRKYSRTGAKQRYSVEEVLNDLKECRVVLGKHKKSDVAEESRFAYKDIDFVIQNELDLAKPVKKLKTLGVVKG